MLAKRLVACCTALVVVVGTTHAINVTIDHTTRHQTIVGFGGNPDGNADQIRDFVDNGVVSAVRIDWCGDLSRAKGYWDAGCRVIVGSCWSPPAHMKTTGKTAGGGSLKADMHDEFADYALERLRSFRQQYGGEMYAICPQNEPRFEVFYNSCKYTAPDFMDVTKRIGERIESNGLKTRLNIADDMYDAFMSPFVRALLGSPEVQPYIHALSFHGYEADGVTAADLQAGTLASMYNIAHKKGWELWQTENAGSYGLRYASDVIGCLRYGKVSMYLKYGLIGNSPGMVGDGDEYYIYKGNKTLTYYVAKTVSKFIRPGAVQLKSTSSDSASFTNFVAFYHPEDKTLTVTLATTSSPRTVSIVGEGLPSTFQKWVTNAGTKCVNQGDVSPTNISIPANSAVALYATGYTPPATATVGARALPRAPGLSTKPQAAHYSLLGRRVSPAPAGRTRSATRGIMVRRGERTRLMLRD